ncbi:ABC transporter permease subunit [Duganella sp. BJB488]|uniref:PhnE/PtxC family ABC transporter permease n=1 Tax=unclassified Duganella TaxID=2636909 RepID=UPI000E3572F4|nr:MULTISPECIES: ABC transporter permease [unclassified Duganella]RFP15250.1 ABC transporter permease subunit [Duganella sp. BJB489]RFP19806.1 ABC transporter permease subunit [Duganella sp. BJB488]RFP38193.1 ABC transporter permease subunit [Duganella sp. BJB480]
MATLSSHPDPAWRGRVTATVVCLLILWPALVITEFKPWILFDWQSISATGRFLADFLVPAHSSEFLAMLLEQTWLTVAIATSGLALALLGAIPATLIVNEQLSISRLGTGRMRPLAMLVRQSVRWTLVLLRSVPELVWALLFVRIIGLGPTAGVLAIALTYCGMLGKVYAEILESSDSHASDTLLVNGSGRLAALMYGALPEAASELMSYTFYRWECAVRGSVVMGFVGAGGLGQRMDESMKMLAGAQVSSMLLVFVLLVALADQFSKVLRRRLG